MTSRLVGYKNVAFELIDYANVMRDCWPAIQGKTALQPDEVQHAKLVGERCTTNPHAEWQ